jgi:hypothetical protein
MARQGKYRRALTPRQLALVTQLRKVDAIYRQAEAERAKLILACWEAFVPATRIGDVLNLSDTGITGMIYRWQRKRRTMKHWWLRDTRWHSVRHPDTIVGVEQPTTNGGQSHGSNKDGYLK